MRNRYASHRRLYGSTGVRAKADEEQITILQQGKEAWDFWRDQFPDVAINLASAILEAVDLKEANLSNANLNEARLINADLSHANLYRAKLIDTDFTGANLMGTDLRDADLNMSNLDKANLESADLSGANLAGANLGGANLRGANLSRANLCDANLINLQLTRAVLDGTTFGHNSLDQIIDLDTVVHSGPSTIGVDTLKISRGLVSEKFLRGCGLSDWEIESSRLFNPDLTNEEVNETLYKIYDLRAGQALQISPLFISYSHSDRLFVDKLDSHLTKNGVRFWRDIHQATAGRLEKQINRAIRQNPTVLLILSRHAVESDWVAHEVRKARELEKELKRDVLCPVALDTSWKTCAWPERMMEQILEYNILDFSKWKDDYRFYDTFRKLINGLDLYYKT